MLVNIYASNRGWLFEDLKEAFRDSCTPTTFPTTADGSRVYVTATDDPLPEADAWICLRTNELDRSPDLSRTLATVHDFWPHPELTSILNRVGGVSIVHQQQRETLGPAGAPPLYGDFIHCRPIGARQAFRLRESMPERFTVGWVGRNMIRGGQSIKRPHLLAEAAAEVGCRVIALTPNAGLGPNADYWRPDRGHRRTPSLEQLQRFYESIDVLVVTSLPEPGPLSIWEALRCGVPVIGTQTGPLMEGQPLCGHVGMLAHDNVEHLALCIRAHADQREAWFETRRGLRRLAVATQEDWIAANVRLACEVANG